MANSDNTDCDAIIREVSKALCSSEIFLWIYVITFITSLLFLTLIINNFQYILGTITFNKYTKLKLTVTMKTFQIDVSLNKQ